MNHQDILLTLDNVDSKTLARWWCKLNRWGWPKELGEPESRDALGHGRRRSTIMKEIKLILGERECLKEWKAGIYWRKNA